MKKIVTYAFMVVLVIIGGLMLSNTVAQAELTEPITLVGGTDVPSSQDMAKMTCAEYLELQDNSVVRGWLDGYVSSESKITMISNYWWQEFSVHLNTYCTEHPTQTALKAMQAFPKQEHYK